jgi:transcription antitermination factor NusB
VRKRTRGRELALQVLYQIDARGEEAMPVIDAFLEQEEPNSPDVHAFAKELVDGTSERRAEIDTLLSSAAENWRLARMAIVDRNILRMAIFEMLHLEEIPAKVSINEAIELGKRFSTKQSGSFINGILDRIRREKDL